METTQQSIPTLLPPNITLAAHIGSFQLSLLTAWLSPTIFRFFNIEKIAQLSIIMDG